MNPTVQVMHRLLAEALIRNGLHGRVAVKGSFLSKEELWKVLQESWRTIPEDYLKE